MSKKIVKVVFDDATELLVGEIKTIEEIKTSYTYDKDWKVQNHYERQFKKIENSILKTLDNDTVEDYAKDYLDLIEEDDCDKCKEKDVSDFEDGELMAEVTSRNLFGYTNVNIITLDLFTRFSRVITVADNQYLEAVISELETKYKL